jgi:hypothetical protein
MGRPKLKDEVKKERISITLPRQYKKAVLNRGNASNFIEDTIRLYLQLEETVKRLSKQKKPSKDLLEELEDIVDSVHINLRRDEDSVPAEDAFSRLWHKRR